MIYQIPYINEILEVEIPQRNLIFNEIPLNVPPAEDLNKTIHHALKNPIGTQLLSSLVRKGMKVIIVSDDNTRLTPTKQIIPTLLDYLNQAGIPDQDIQIIIASGTHRAMTDIELEEKYGEPVISRVKVLPHDYKDPNILVNYGRTERGTNILVNRHVVEADFRIAVGSVIPHHPTGWGAGAKAVLPGVGGEETVAQMHFLGSKDPSLGRLDTEMRKEMEDFAVKIGLDFIFNAVLNREGMLVDAFAGHFIDAHRAGVAVSKTIYGVTIPEQADITISSTSPVDFDFFQGDKGITSAELATKNGGEIILVSGCIEGVSPAHPELATYVGKMNNDQIWDILHANQAPDPLTGAEAIVINDIKDKMGITVASNGLSPELCAQMGFRHVDPYKLNEYIQLRLVENPDLKIGILKHSAEIMPILA